MGFRSVLGTIIIIIAVINLLIFMVLLLVIFAECSLGLAILPDPDFTKDLSKCNEAYFNFGVGLIASFVWLGIGILIRGKPNEIRI